MSDQHFHVHGAHEHEVEHRGSHESGLPQQAAIFTAILATLGAVVSYQGGATQIEAMLHKNEAVLKRTEASDQWNYYQAKSQKQNLAALGATLALSPERVDFYKKEIERYEKERKEIKGKAEELEKQAQESNRLAEERMHPHHRLAQAMTLIQIAISLASITVLTRKTWLLWIGGAAAAGGIVLAGIALTQL